jgi:hypoxanthine phosphoribosyltransferase
MTTSRQRSLSKGSGKTHISWAHYIQCINELQEKIVQSGVKFDFIYAVPRGGLIPGVILSNQLDIKLITTYQTFNLLYQMQPEALIKNKILVLDDIVDNGKTFQPFSIMNKKYVMTASVFKHAKSPITPDFFVRTVHNWQIFPYEKE